MAMGGAVAVPTAAWSLLPVAAAPAGGVVTGPLYGPQMSTGAGPVVTGVAPPLLSAAPGVPAPAAAASVLLSSDCPRTTVQHKASSTSASRIAAART